MWTSLNFLLLNLSLNLLLLNLLSLPPLHSYLSQRQPFKHVDVFELVFQNVFLQYPLIIWTVSKAFSNVPSLKNISNRYFSDFYHTAKNLLKRQVFHLGRQWHIKLWELTWGWRGGKGTPSHLLPSAWSISREILELAARTLFGRTKVPHSISCLMHRPAFF